ncbi:hypothetical protein Vadar_001776 [Vaccinium darrowii]|uniref:Uncharacterized protein n=1 Tax=Vaccinium darrowii TaxID=229202 RepID=A0ACB7ZHI1_9ERIC|nr:hypothetical protein Vadar_001776 [Vaccinium darrowii]
MITNEQPSSSDDMNETNCPGVEKIQKYDPVFILRFSIHSLSMGFIEPVKFASLGLLAIAFVSISSPHDEMRKLGYEALGGFKTALEKCQKRKDLMRLRLLLTYLQNGIEEPWQRIPSITTKFVAEASIILLDPLHDHYSTISKFLISSTRVNMKSVPLFANFLWSSSVNFRTDRLWMLRLLYAGLDSDDDARIYIRNNILEILLVFYASPLSDIESKELTLQVVNDVISNRNIIEWLQQFALEQLSELSTHLYKLLVGGNLTDENVYLVTSVLEILASTLKISQEWKVYQPHFTLSVEGLFKIYKVVNEQDKLLLFVRWATSTALQSSSVKELQPTEAYCHSAILLGREQYEDSLLSKLLRWLTASVILGRLSLRFEKSNLETLHSLLELDKKGCGESQFGFGCEEILAACIFGLLPLLGMGC